MKNNF